MYEAGLAVLREPGEIKARLPIAYVLEQAGVSIIQGEGRLHALCPWHDDHDPSLDVYRWGDSERFGCFVCGAGGDVFDAIQRFWPMSFPASVEAGKRAISKMEAEGWTAPTLCGPLDWNEAAARRLWQQGNCGDVQQLIGAKGWSLDHLWLHARWLTIAVNRELLVPYFNQANELVAMKHRPLDGTRHLISLPGSKLKGVLYGEWRTQRRDLPVLLCEGESDTWYADRYLSERFDVLGIPAGVGATPTRLDLLAGREVVVAFDGDEAGRLGASRWREALASVNCHVRVFDTPEGYDLATLPNLQEVN